MSFMLCYVLCYEFLSRIASSVLKVNCYQWGSCVGGPSAFNSPFGNRSRSHNISPLDNHLSGLSISLSSLVLSWVIDIALKLGAQLSISIAIFQVFGMTRLWLELTTFRSGGEHSTFTLPVGSWITTYLKSIFLKVENGSQNGWDLQWPSNKKGGPNWPHRRRGPWSGSLLLFIFLFVLYLTMV